METTDGLMASDEIRKVIKGVPRTLFLSGETFLDLEDGKRWPSPPRQVLPPMETVCRMIAALELNGHGRVLEIGTGFGYTAAILSSLADEVHTVEWRPERVLNARADLVELGCENITLYEGDGMDRSVVGGTFDAILVAASETEVPRTLLGRLSVGGRLVVALGSRQGVQRLMQIRRKSGNDFVETRLGEVRLIPRLGDILVDLGVVSREEVETAAQRALEAGEKIGHTLQSTTHVEEVDVYRGLALQRGITLARVETLLETLDKKLIEAVPRPYLEQNRIIPLSRKGHRLAVATSDPSAETLTLAQALEAREVDLFLLTSTDYRRLWSALDLGALPLEPAREVPVEVATDDLLEAAAPVFDARIVNVFESLLLDAIGERASDIHLERYQDEVRVRFRIDGDLVDQKRYQLQPQELLALVNVIKINADLDIAERRLPQGGRIRRHAGKTSYDLRVQTQPCLHGEHVVIRLLPQDQRILTIEDLGFPETIAHHYRRLIESPAGLLLVVGPTGSGKSTTLYAALQILAQDARRKVITVEDPIEYSLRGIQQTQVKPRIGFAFADAMRAFVREDPDVILVGEIRDHETGIEAIRASQTGHLVLSTLHANDAVDAVQRLMDLELHPNSVASELIGVIAQRLAKRICTGCRIPAEPDPAILAELFPDGAPEGFRAFKGKGCPRCDKRGTHGRIAVIEFLRASSHVRRAISRRLQVDELRDLCLEAGLSTMRDTAVQLVQAGMIPLDELPRILPAERMAPEKTSQ
ncbi:MAG: ATPase, T2SS/T4P/T4SS family [Bradymonadaceae bacterium]